VHFLHPFYSPECHSDAASRGPVDRRQLLRRIDRAWRDFQDSHAGLSNEQMLEPGVTGAWSVRDIIAHVTTWDEEALKHLPLVLKGGKPPRYSLTYGGIDAFNALMTEQKKDLSLPEVLPGQPDPSLALRPDSARNKWAIAEGEQLPKEQREQVGIEGLSHVEVP
jgi:hypothetical protein